MAFREITVEHRVLGVLLGLGDIAPRELCHGFQNGCVCLECSERIDAAQVQIASQIAQPWEPRRRAA